MLATRIRLALGGVAIALLCVPMVSVAEAHPHVWITAKTTVLHDHGAFVGLSYTWTFDQDYTATAIEGLDKNGDGVYDRAELNELAKVNMDGLKEYAYFSHVFLSGRKVPVGEARDYWLEHKGGLLVLHLTLPFAEPVPADAKGFAFAVHDPEFFIAFDLEAPDSVKLGVGAPKGCAVKMSEPEQKPGDGTALGELQAQMGAFADGLRMVSVDCRGP
jgi:ABC-type uncharacterized transport system substrate-binding protein